MKTASRKYRERAAAEAFKEKMPQEREQDKMELEKNEEYYTWIMKRLSSRLLISKKN